MSRKGWACERVRLQKVAQLILPPHPHRRPSDTRPRLFLGCFAYRDQLQRRDFLQFDHRDGIVTDVADRDHAFRLHLFEISSGFDSDFFPVSMRARLTIEPLAKLQWCDEFSTGMSGKRGVRGVLG
jgi:hypothetical protein